MKQVPCHRHVAKVAVAALLGAACTERVADMDAERPVVNLEATKNAADDVVVVLNEQVKELQSDGTRLYWYGQSSEFFCTGTNHWALRSCLIDHCASTLVTYTEWSRPCSYPGYSEDTGGRTYTAGYVGGDRGRFVIESPNIYWGAQLQSCPISGCPAEPAIEADANMTTEHVMGERMYWLNPNDPFGVQRCVPERCADTTETLADLSEAPVYPAVRSLTLTDTHAYWISGSHIRRIALDDPGAVETVTSATTNPKGLSVVGEDQYWANQIFPGAIVRCASALCADGGPFEVVGRQTYPNWTGVIGSTLIWSNTNGMGYDSQLQYCSLADCAGSVESLEPTATFILGRSIHERTIYFGTSTDDARSTMIHRRQF